MVKIILDLPETIDHKLQHYKIDRKLKRKSGAIVEILDRYFRNNPDFFIKNER